MALEPILIFRNGTLILPDRTLEDGVVVCCDGRIQAVGRASEIEDASGGSHAPSSAP